MAGIELAKLDRAAEASRERARIIRSNYAVGLALQDQSGHPHSASSVAGAMASCDSGNGRGAHRTRQRSSARTSG